MARRTRTTPLILLLLGLALIMAGAMGWQRLGGASHTPVAAGAAAGPLLTGTFTLAASWEPAFCETEPRKPECKSQTGARFDARNLALHGLWPEPKTATYCDVSQAHRTADRSGYWRALPALALTDGTRTALDQIMPGTRSFLQRHEWIKHGTCSGAGEEGYFAASLALMNALNATEVRTLLTKRVGQYLSANQIRASFDRAFGKGAGRRVTLECARVGGRTLISELRIALSGAVGPAPDLKTLLAAAPTRPRGCPGGIVDAAGID